MFKNNEKGSRKSHIHLRMLVTRYQIDLSKPMDVECIRIFKKKLLGKSIF